MVRARFVGWFCLVGLVAVTGCCYPVLGRRAIEDCGCSASNNMEISEGPVLQGNTAVPPESIDGQVPPLAPPPRLVPEPSSKPTPYVPPRSTSMRKEREKF
ncbi:MAG: hypothetical protein KatS3mg105_2119 [Gemmatales bacterium]|nr:MAG: hypothetical protein KatS3mg105_2119 [Gemmatales bacterium]